MGDDFDIQAGGSGMTLDELKERYSIFPKGPSIIVIGPDRVGKTTIVDILSKKLGLPKFKAPSEKQIFKEGGRSSLVFDYTLTHFLAQTGYRFISDRGYPCELVYSKVFGRETDWELLAQIDNAHFRLGTKILYLYSSDVPEEEDDLVPKDRYRDVIVGYNYFKIWSHCHITVYDTASMLRAYQKSGDISEQVADDCIKMMGV